MLQNVKAGGRSDARCAEAVRMTPRGHRENGPRPSRFRRKRHRMGQNHLGSGQLPPPRSNCLFQWDQLPGSGGAIAPFAAANCPGGPGNRGRRGQRKVCGVRRPVRDINHHHLSGSHTIDAADYSYSHRGADTSWRPNLSPGAGPRGATPRTTASTQGDRALGFRSDTRKCVK